MAKSNEPIFWSLFSAGGVVAAFFIPITIVLTGMAVPADWISAEALRELAETWIVPQVLALDGVADAQVRGGARPLLKLLLNRQKLDMYRINADEVFAAIDGLDELSGAGVVRQFVPSSAAMGHHYCRG